MSLKRRNWFVRTWYKLINPILRKTQKSKLSFTEETSKFYDDLMKERRKKSE